MSEPADAPPFWPRGADEDRVRACPCRSCKRIWGAYRAQREYGRAAADPDQQTLVADGGEIQRGTCHVCKRDLSLDGEEAIERFGEVICADCTGKPVVFVAECQNQLCPWSYRREDTEFNRGWCEQLVRSEANTHQRKKRVFDDDPTHRVEVREVELVADGGTLQVRYCQHCGTALADGACPGCRAGQGALKYEDGHASWREVYRECHVSPEVEDERP